MVGGAVSFVRRSLLWDSIVDATVGEGEKFVVYPLFYREPLTGGPGQGTCIDSSSSFLRIYCLEERISELEMFILRNLLHMRMREKSEFKQDVMMMTS